MVKNKELVWRITAVISTLIWTVVLFSLVAFPVLADGGVVTSTFNIILYGLSICISFVLLFLPIKFYLYATMCWIWGLFNIVDGGSNNGLLMYALGCLFAYKQDFFAKRTPVKYLILFPPLIAFGFQYRLGTTIMVASVIDLLFLLMFFLLAFFLFGEFFLLQNSEKPSESAGKIGVNEFTPEDLLRLKKLLAGESFKAGQNTEKHSGTVGKVDLSVLMVDELAMIKEVVQEGKTFYDVGKARNKGLSSVKQLMTDIYEKLGIDSKNQLVQLYKEEKLIFPK